jgi:iron complex transport system substrate-binding protein
MPRIRLPLATLALALMTTLPAWAAGFPVSIENAFGTTTVPAKPLRVVSIGYVEQDFLYALGVAPVGVREWFGGKPYATWEWAEPARAALGAEPAVFQGDTISYEWVLAQNPDLIVGTFVEMDQASYDQLSQIAPVIALPKGYDAWGAPWRVELRDIDLATSGDTTRSDAIVARIDAKFAAVQAAHPEFAGKVGTNLYYSDGSFTLFDERDPASRFLIDLGLTFPPAFAGQGGEGNMISVSAENIRSLDFDVAVWPVNTDVSAARATVEAVPLYQQTRLYRHSVWLDDGGVLTGALTYQSPLAIDYLLDELPSRLAAALAGNP